MELVASLWCLVFKIVVLYNLSLAAYEQKTCALRLCCHNELRLACSLGGIKAWIAVERIMLLLLERRLLLRVSGWRNQTYNFVFADLCSTQIEIEDCLLGLFNSFRRNNRHNVIKETFDHFFVVLSRICLAFELRVLSRLNLRWKLVSALTCKIRFKELRLISNIETIREIDIIYVLVVHKMGLICA